MNSIFLIAFKIKIVHHRRFSNIYLFLPKIFIGNFHETISIHAQIIIDKHILMEIIR